MSVLPPMHPYMVMLCDVSDVIYGYGVEKMHMLGRLMGCRDTADIVCPTLLFQRLEKERNLSEFKVTPLLQALDCIGLYQAAARVRKYEDLLSGQDQKVSPSVQSSVSVPVDETGDYMAMHRPPAYFPTNKSKRARPCLPQVSTTAGNNSASDEDEYDYENLRSPREAKDVRDGGARVGRAVSLDKGSESAIRSLNSSDMALPVARVGNNRAGRLPVSRSSNVEREFPTKYYH